MKLCTVGVQRQLVDKYRKKGKLQVKSALV